MKKLMMVLELVMFVSLLIGAYLKYTPSIWVTAVWVVISFCETYDCYRNQKEEDDK